MPMDLKGKKIALNKGSNVHYLLLKALEKAGVAYADIQPVFLPPADARAAFERGSVDAWAIWDPFLAAAEQQLGARVLADGKGLVANYQFYLASRTYAEKHPEILRIVLDEVAKVDDWGRNNPDEVAIMSRALAFGKWDFNPHNFLYPSFYFYVLFAWEGLTALLAVTTRSVASFGAFQREFFLDPTRVFVAGSVGGG